MPGDYSVGFEFLADVVGAEEELDASLMQAEDSISTEDTNLANPETAYISEEMWDVMY